VLHGSAVQNLDKEKMFDNERIDKRKNIADGPLYDVSKMSPVSGVAFNQNAYFFGESNMEAFKQLIRLTNDDFQNTEINLFGQRGAGKTRLVQQVVQYLRNRCKFGRGIYMFDLAS
jgi:hypothetical protein